MDGDAPFLIGAAASRTTPLRLILTTMHSDIFHLGRCSGNRWRGR
jgi:hypothetical protein